MPTQKLDPRQYPELQSASSLWPLYQPQQAPLRFQAKTLDEALAWQRSVREELAKTIGFQDWPDVPFEPRLIESVDKDDYVREKVLIWVGPHARMPVYLLIPKNRVGALPTVLAFNGHGYGVKDIVGLWEDGQERDTPDGYQKDFAVSLCRSGFLVAAPEVTCFGERQTDFSYINTLIGQEIPPKCQHTAMLAFHLGGSVIGLRVREGRRLLDYLLTRPEVDAQHIGAMGISGGGMHTFFSTCLDERIRACVVSGYYSTFRDSVLAMDHCTCNFVPGLYRFGEMYDLVGLIAPRPMLVEAGSYDPIFPIDSVKRSIARAREVYSVFGAEDRVETDFFEGRHQISGRKAYRFLAADLNNR